MMYSGKEGEPMGVKANEGSNPGEKVLRNGVPRTLDGRGLKAELERRDNLRKTGFAFGENRF